MRINHNGDWILAILATTTTTTTTIGEKNSVISLKLLSALKVLLEKVASANALQLEAARRRDTAIPRYDWDATMLIKSTYPFLSYDVFAADNLRLTVYLQQLLRNEPRESYRIRWKIDNAIVRAITPFKVIHGSSSLVPIESSYSTSY